MTAEAPAISRLLDLSGRTAIVTGASGGIGRGIAKRFAEAGAKVVCHYRSNRTQAEALVAAIERSGGEAVAVEANISTRSGAKTLMAEAVRRFGAVHILVNNAGIQPDEALLDISQAGWEAMFSVNAGGPFLLTQAFAEHVKARGGPSGAIVNIASIQAHQPAAGHAHYAASKAALVMFTRAAALELGPLGIRVNSVSPGLIEREGLEDAWPEGVERWRETAPLGRLGRADDVAGAALFLASDAARWITGADLLVDGGVSARPTW